MSYVNITNIYVEYVADKGKELIKSSTDNLYVLERIRDAFILSTEQAALAGLVSVNFIYLSYSAFKLHIMT